MQSATHQLRRAKTMVVQGAKSSQIRLMNRMGRYRTPQQLHAAAQDWVDTHEQHLFESAYWSYEEGLRKGRQLEQRDKDAQLRDTILVRLVRLQAESPRLRCVIVSAPSFVHAQGDMDPYCFGADIRVESLLELRVDDPFYHAIMAILSQRYDVSF
ncbi:hypothetical protein BJ085DRAFT_37161 [Dimargaris cristalligena]|uniref:Uncharacterized protein n=1 Tax=Dimargaris cristalligena TaxID=215637 RepID=A0A4V1J4Q3_9FUNG|nr:hypothetical protein BJ085DRAFT_37161 [Dimargaris cristalligena]|eukprot:RKP36359.1 hypothetical protein BJ085DRAFT_37161 [Dimargaris cristalligena]